MNPTLSIVLGKHGQVEDIRSGAVKVEGVNLEFKNFDRMPDAYRMMVRTTPFDICELAPTTYLMAREAGVPITALPLPMTRAFRHGGLQRLRDSNVREPKQLEGRSVGVRAYSVTAPVWTRGILAEEFGVDLGKITWLKEDEEHVETYRLPSNVQSAPAGKTLSGMMRDGELEVGFSGLAGVGSTDTLDLVEFFEDAAAMEKDWYQRTRIYPLHGVIAVKNDVLKSHPHLARNLFDAFSTARDNYWARVTAGTSKGKDDQRYLKLANIVGDPLPYGLKENASSFEALIRFSTQQKLIRKPTKIAEAFPDPRDARTQTGLAKGSA